MKPVLRGHRIKRTPSIKRTVAEVPKFISLIYFKWTFIKRTPLLSGRGHLKSTWNCHFYCCKPVLNGHHPTCQTQEMRKFATYKVFDFYIIKRDLTQLFDQFHRTGLFSISFYLYRACFTLQISVAIYVYCTMINWSTLIKKLLQTYIVIVSGSILNVSTVHLIGIWYLIWRYLSKSVLGEHPVLSGHYSIPRGCPLNTGFTVLKFVCPVDFMK